MKIEVPRILAPSGRPAARTPRVAVGYPHGGQTTGAFLESMLALQRYELARDPQVLVYFLPQTGFFIEDNRNEIARRFLETDADWLLMVDSDIGFPPQLVEMLLAVAGTQRKVLGASVPLGPPLPSCGLRMITPRAGEWSGTWLYLEPEEIAPDGTEVHGLAMPVFLAHREVYEAVAKREGQSWFLRKQVPRLNDEKSRRAWLDLDGNAADRQYVNQGEDLSFCLRAVDAGYRLWCCRLPGLRHHKVALPLSHDDHACPQCGHDQATEPVAMEG